MGTDLPKLIISSAGTSIATNYVSGNEINQLDNYSTKEWEDTAEKRKEIERKIFKSEKFKSHLADQNWSATCAEINTLLKVGVDANRDEVWLLVSDTNSGRFCAEMIKKITKEHFGWNVNYHVVEGLQVRDSQMFERYGIRNYIEKIIQLHNNNKYKKDIILIPTGGFKGVVPYTTLLGMIYQLKMYYIFEDSKTLINLPWLPMSFNFKPLENIADKLHLIEEDGAIKADLFWQGIDYYDREIYLPFILEENGMVTLSNIGLLVWEDYKQTFPPQLVKDDTPPDKKEIKLASTHHGNDQLRKMAKKLNNTPYVKGIINSCEYKPTSRRAISDIKDDGSFVFTLTDTDAGYSMIVQTTGRNLQETEMIARWLEERFKL